MTLFSILKDYNFQLNKTIWPKKQESLKNKIRPSPKETNVKKKRATHKSPSDFRTKRKKGEAQHIDSFKQEKKRKKIKEEEERKK